MKTINLALIALIGLAAQSADAQIFKKNQIPVAEEKKSGLGLKLPKLSRKSQVETVVTDAAAREKKGSLPKFRRKNDSSVVPNPSDVFVNSDGNLVAANSSSSGTGFQVTKPSSSSGQGGPSRKEGDSIIYSSWEDVPGNRSSAADRITSDLKKQEAAHDRVKAEQQRKFESQVRKAQEARRKAAEERRIRAIMQGGLGGGTPSF